MQATFVSSPAWNSPKPTQTTTARSPKRSFKNGGFEHIAILFVWLIQSAALETPAHGMGFRLIMARQGLALRHLQVDDDGSTALWASGHWFTLSSLRPNLADTSCSFASDGLASARESEQAEDTAFLGVDPPPTPYQMRCPAPTICDILALHSFINFPRCSHLGSSFSMQPYLSLALVFLIMPS